MSFFVTDAPLRMDLPITKRHLEELHELADAVRYDLGRLTVAYNTDKRNLDRHMRVIMRNLTALLSHLDSHIEGPRAPEERRTRLRSDA